MRITIESEPGEDEPAEPIEIRGVAEYLVLGRRMTGPTTVSDFWSKKGGFGYLAGMCLYMVRVLERSNDGPAVPRKVE